MKILCPASRALHEFQGSHRQDGYRLQEDSDAQKGIFRCTAGQHGIPDVLPIMELKHGLDIFHDLTCISCPDISSVSSGQRKIQVEDRVEIISIFLDNGPKSN